MKEVKMTLRQISALYEIENEITTTKEKIKDIIRYQETHPGQNFIRPDFFYQDSNNATGSTSMIYLRNGLNDFLRDHWEEFMDHMNKEMNKLHAQTSKDTKKAMLRSLGMLDDEDDL